MRVDDGEGLKLAKYVGWMASRFVARESQASVGILAEVRPSSDLAQRHVVDLVLDRAVDFERPSIAEPGRFRGKKIVSEAFTGYTSTSSSHDLVTIETACEALRTVTVLQPAGDVATWPVELWVFERDFVIQLPAYSEDLQPREIRVARSPALRRADGDEVELCAVARDDGLFVSCVAPILARPTRGAAARTEVLAAASFSIGERFMIGEVEAVVALAPSVIAKACASPRVARLTLGPMLQFDRRPRVRM